MKKKTDLSRRYPCFRSFYFMVPDDSEVLFNKYVLTLTSIIIPRPVIEVLWKNKTLNVTQRMPKRFKKSEMMIKESLIRELLVYLAFQ